MATDDTALMDSRGTRNPTLAKAMLAAWKQDEKWQSTEHVKPLIYLTKNRLIAYHKFWDGMRSDDASSEFENQHVHEDGKNDTEDGQRKVAVEDNARQDSISGSGNREVRPRSCPGSVSSSFVNGG